MVGEGEFVRECRPAPSLQRPPPPLRGIVQRLQHHLAFDAVEHRRQRRAVERRPCRVFEIAQHVRGGDVAAPGRLGDPVDTGGLIRRHAGAGDIAAPQPLHRFRVQMLGRLVQPAHRLGWPALAQKQQSQVALRLTPAGVRIFDQRPVVCLQPELRQRQSVVERDPGALGLGFASSPDRKMPSAIRRHSVRWLRAVIELAVLREMKDMVAASRDMGSEQFMGCAGHGEDLT